MNSTAEPRYTVYNDDSERNAPSNESLQQHRASDSSRRTTSNAPSRTARQSDTLFFVAITENRMREIGIAAIDLKSPRLLLSQFSDTHTFILTFTKLHIYDPVEIIVPHTAANSELSKLIQNKFPNSTFSTVQRKYFNETKGLLYLKDLVISDLLATVECISTKYLCLASSSALIKYCEFVQTTTFLPHSLQLLYSGGDKSMTIDAETLKNLEILINARSGSAKGTLFSVVNHTKTAVGMRLLRSNLVQPTADVNTINARLDVIEEFLKNEKMYFETAAILDQFLDLDQIIHRLNLIMMPKRQFGNATQTVVKNIICLKHTLKLIPQLVQVLSSSQNEVLKAICNNLKHESFQVMMREIEKVINEDCEYSKSVYHMRMQLCFAVKPGINGLLDVARTTYKETIEDMHTLVRKYKENYPESCTSLKLQFSARRGHFLILDNPTSKTSNPQSSLNLPDAFIQITHHGKKIHCSTEELNRLNSRNNDSLSEVLLITEKILSELVGLFRQHVGSIYKLSDSVALLDMLSGFAHLVQTSNIYVRPDFYNDGPLVVKQGRHPIMEKLSNESFIPNDYFATEGSNFQIITGYNMSGKSTYIRSIALIAILAHVGCYVPAQYCAIPIRTALFARIGTSDQIETNSSSFMREMTEMSFILKNAGDKSLIIIDELGRSTSNSDGIALSWSMCESLLQKQAFTFFVTHYLELCDLQTLYSNAKNYHLVVDRSTPTVGLRFMFQIAEGSIKEDSYGIETAEKSGLDSQLISIAKEIEKKLSNERKDKKKSADDWMDFKTLAQRLLALKASTLDDESLRAFLVGLKKNSK